MKLLALVDIPSNFFLNHPGAQTLTTDPGTLVSKLFLNILVIAGMIFFFLIIAGGFSLVVGAGKNSSPQEAAKAQAALTYGLVGFLLVVSAYFILQIVGTAIGVNLINPGI